MAILENQNFGKLAECAQYQALLQKNLMYLAAIADAQPPATAPTPVAMMTPQAMQQTQPSYFMQQHQQAVGMAQQIPPGLYPPRGPLQFGSLHQLQDPQQQLHQQAMQGHMGIRPMMGFTSNNGLQHSMMHQPEAALGVNNAGPDDARGGGKQDGTGVSQSGK